MKKCNLNIFLITFLFWVNIIFSQTNQKDSLLHLLEVAKMDTQKISLLVDLSNKVSPENPEQGLLYAKQAFRFFSKKLNERYKQKIFLKLAYSFEDTGQNDSALYFYSQYKNISAEIKDSVAMAYGFNMIGSAKIYLGKYPDAMLNCNTALKLAEQIGDKKNIGIACNNIGNLFYFQGDKKLAIKYWERALAINKELNDYRNTGKTLSNIAAVYNELGEFEKARKLLYEALSLHKQRNDIAGITNTLTNIGLSYAYAQDFKSALKIYTYAYQLADSINEQRVMIAQLTNIGECYFKMNNISESIKSFKKSDSLSVALKIPEGRREALFGLSEVYYANGDYKLAFETSKLLGLVSDSIMNSQIAEQTAELETKYQTEKKDAENKLLQTENQLSVKTIKQQRIITYFIIGGLLIVSVLAFFIFRGLKKQRKANEIISKQKQVVEEQKFLVEHQKHLIEEKHKEITDSINYAERIQRSFIATKQMLDDNLMDYFVLFKPKDIVSGDFYWAAKLHDDKFAFVTADSTGHGVPGAIMSLLNITSLEKAIESYIRPSDILNSTRKTIIERLKKDGSEEGGKDGMDASLCVFDFKNKKLTIAAANNPVWIVRIVITPGRESADENQYEVIEVKPDKMPIGKHDRQDVPFSQQEFDLQKGDFVYTLTDGFPDQFGGEKGKKFMSKNLRELLVANAHLPMYEQKILLQNTFANWVGNIEQVDDVTVVGIRV